MTHSIDYFSPSVFQSRFFVIYGLWVSILRKHTVSFYSFTHDEHNVLSFESQFWGFFPTTVSMQWHKTWMDLNPIQLNDKTGLDLDARHHCIRLQVFPMPYLCTWASSAAGAKCWFSLHESHKNILAFLHWLSLCGWIIKCCYFFWRFFMVLHLCIVVVSY